MFSSSLRIALSEAIVTSLIFTQVFSPAILFASDEDTVLPVNDQVVIESQEEVMTTPVDATPEDISSAPSEVVGSEVSSETQYIDVPQELSQTGTEIEAVTENIPETQIS